MESIRMVSVREEGCPLSSLSVGCTILQGRSSINSALRFCLLQEKWSGRGGLMESGRGKFHHELDYAIKM
eukprot:scaffold142715_cov58-Attheya_sp.AAC.4